MEINEAKEIKIGEYQSADCGEVTAVWNEVILAANAFPQEEPLGSYTEADEFFKSQTYTGVAKTEAGEVAGVYILHPNFPGRCGHICNASFAVRKDLRGRHIGRSLVLHCGETAKQKGFSILELNAVVADNHAALALYKELGFKQLGAIPNAYRKGDGTFEDIIPHYWVL